MKIQALTLYTSNLVNQLGFYKDTLGIEVVEKSVSSFTLKIGASHLQFIANENTTPYHFAFNIPAHQETAALNWLKDRVEVLKYDDSEIQEFSNWNAKAVYFYDAEKNIVEFISRRRILDEVPEPFTAKSVLSISEIGLVTDTIEPVYQKLNAQGVEVFDGNMHRFCAAGDDHGLFIIINPKAKKWFPTNEKAYHSPFEIEVEFEERIQKMKYEKNDLQLV